MAARVKAFYFLFNRLNFFFELDLFILKCLLGFSFSEDDGLLVIKLLLETCSGEILPSHTPLSQGLFLDEHSLFIFNLSALHEKDFALMLLVSLQLTDFCLKLID